MVAALDLAGLAMPGRHIQCGYQPHRQHAPAICRCVGCYFLGMLLLDRPVLMRLLLAGILAGFTVCLMRAVDQRVFEYSQTYQTLVEGRKIAGRTWHRRRF